jgi:crossover junction endodeoxyribonuclease RusA
MRLVIPWTPKAKSRPRVKGKQAYTDPATRAAEAAIAEAFKDLVGPGFQPFTGPIDVTFQFFDNRVSIQIIDAEDYTCRKLRGDLDNYVKILADSLNGVAWVDDKQIVGLRAWKM